MAPGNDPDPIVLHQTQSGEREPATPELAPDSGVKWPSIPSPKLPPMNESGWPSVWFPPKSEPRVLTPEEQARLADDQAQQAALEVVIEFLNNTDVADDDDYDEEYDEYMDAIKYENGDIDEVIEEKERKRFDFFVKLFEEDRVLMDYYEKNCAGGEFRCLVCFAVREKGWKRFKGCAALVHHCLSIAKTTKRKAHQALAESICKALGWDINKLIHSSNKSAEAPGNIDNYSKDGLDLSGSTADIANDNTGKVSGNENKSGGQSEINALAKGDNSKHIDILSCSIQDVESANTKGSPNGQDRTHAHSDAAQPALDLDHQEDKVPADLNEDKVHN
ncbi:unnamed protein product [Cuscuta epithymum]|uniref:Uncharacterized protein n=1 Tax=Cuscuta epithymum TaxID=186058 RepID=A0AAV0DR31_9ASTE|nr:unnamed protein product [Cuscuta epithymum]